MNFEIREKYNDFIKIIEDKEKNINNPIIKQFVNNKQSKLFSYEDNSTNNKSNHNENCSCGISSGYETVISKKKKSPINLELNQDRKSKSDKKSSNTEKKNDDLSLLEDDYFVSKNKNNISKSGSKENLPCEFFPPSQNHPSVSKENNIYSNKSVNTEFKNIFMINDIPTNTNIIKKNESSEIKNKLENIYNKILTKKYNNNQTNLNLNGFHIEKYIKNGEIINKKTIDTDIKKLSDMVEYVFGESIRGWNQEQGIYIVHFDKLKENFQKIIFTNNSKLNHIKMGFIYRDFNEPKAYLEKSFTKYWIGYNVDSNFSTLSNSSNLSNPLNLTKYSIKNKILFYCLKNLTKSTKFKKSISKWNYKFIKKTVQIYGNKKLFVDIVLFVGVENVV